MSKTLIASFTKKDFRVQCFAAGGPGGQNQNKVASAVRITHLPTGLAAKSTESRDQHQNKKTAFLRLAEMLKAHYTVKRDAENMQKLMQADPQKYTIRTYHQPDNRVIDKASGFRQEYKYVVEKGVIDEMVTARRLAMLKAE